MNILISFIKAIAVFDLLVIAVYFGGDILTTVMDRFRKKPVQDGKNRCRMTHSIFLLRML